MLSGWPVFVVGRGSQWALPIVVLVVTPLVVPFARSGSFVALWLDVLPFHVPLVLLLAALLVGLSVVTGPRLETRAVALVVGVVSVPGSELLVRGVRGVAPCVWSLLAPFLVSVLNVECLGVQLRQVRRLVAKESKVLSDVAA